MSVMDMETAIAAATEKAGEEWQEKALLTIENLARTSQTFTADDVWLAGLERPENSRALGGVMRLARKQGLIEPTDRLVTSVFESGHYGPRRVWRSLARRVSVRAAA